MTETPVEEAATPEALPPKPEVVNCRHCNKKHELAPDETADGDWLCTNAKCERYQDSAICPTCGQVARPSLMKGAS